MTSQIIFTSNYQFNSRIVSYKGLVHHLYYCRHESLLTLIIRIEIQPTRLQLGMYHL